VLGVLASVVSAAYYLRVLLACFAPPRLDAVAPRRARIGTAIVVLAALAVIVLGVAPVPLLEAARTVRF
jgi:NADH:ubiquinone oxidoreductase subunit 2 (subunit N)